MLGTFSGVCIVSSTPAAPPKPALIFCAGITGHRALPRAARDKLAVTLRDLLGRLEARVTRVQADNADLFQPEPAQLFLLSQLAKGADQVAADAALSRGYKLRAVLPFEPDVYRRDFRGADRTAFDRLLAQAPHWWLPAGQESHDRGYALAGQATVAQCDILIAVWDGQAARGPGGTGEVVDYGIRRAIPIIHVPADGVGEIMVLWAGFEGLSAGRLDRDSVPRKPLTEALLAEIVQVVLGPPVEPQEREAARHFFREPKRRTRLRPEYPLLLALTAVRGLRLRSFLSEDPEVATARDWASFREGAVADEPSFAPALDVLQPAFAWADGLADHVAQTYRGGLIFNYVAAALSVICALAGLVLPEHFKTWLLAAELLLIGLLIFNTAVGSGQQWHRRWLDYRYLAEHLRPFRSLKILGAATPPRHLLAGPGRWTDWYARAIWREMGPPPTIPDLPTLAHLVHHIADQEVESQISYNVLNSERMHSLDHRLHQVGTTLFYATVGLGVLTLIGIAVAPDIVHQHAKLLTALSAGLPTAGAALFGIRGQGDFVGASGRSAETAANLRIVAYQLEDGAADLPRACRLVENAAATMLADLGEWRSAYRHRKLAIPA